MIFSMVNPFPDLNVTGMGFRTQLNS
jgi:hypothetical protein